MSAPTVSSYVIAGYASLFGVPDLAGDIVERGAFTETLATLPARDIRMLLQHDPDRPVGRWTGAHQDSQGLWMQGLIDAGNAEARAVLRLIQSGAADGLSIGFRALDATPRLGGGRILKTIDLREVSIVSFPMLPRARLRLRADRPFTTLATHQEAA
jgi:uncharacterized protein